MKKRVILIHGWEGTAMAGWRPWLKAELEKRGFEVIVPQMPNADEPTYETWVPYVKEVVGIPDENTYLIGHSLGCITILRYLEILPANQKVGGVVLVAGFGHDLTYEGYAGELSSFFATLINWQKIKSHCDHFVAIHSEDDPWVPIEHSAIYKDRLGAQAIVLPNMKHFGDDDGFTEVPVILESILKLANS